MDAFTPEILKNNLHQALGSLGDFDSCALLDYPEHLNLGDHLIWLGNIFYLTDVLKAKIKYAASKEGFSKDVLEEKAGNAPILLHGGGNLGDIWPAYQNFREQIITEYRDRPVVILPQCIYFQDLNNLEKTAKVFNSHPNLTIFTRDNRSDDIARKYFDNCRVVKAPDMALQLRNMSGFSSDTISKSSILFHCRNDKELNKEFASNKIDIPHLVVEDWLSYKWVLGTNKKWFKRGIAQLYREVWQRGFATPDEWMARQKWQYLHPDVPKFQEIYQPFLHQRSWSFIYSAIHQFQQHRVIITNRLHGHILCIILGIPHVFLANGYYKNESFYETWTHQIPFCRFIRDAGEVKFAVEELLTLHQTQT
ncbi:MAG: polysaccharide pyruvyl transferase family protein [Scytonematopsis contorta HA4267-MV1]|jgi:pyruvyl transferase EpsO|nr:polysaccharide pyruvyl transferase family protein [Scytonematopsis contorta HA4267-MV1]